MNTFIDESMIGGVSQARNLYLKANNPTVEGYNSTEENSYLLLLDANNHYGNYSFIYLNLYINIYLFFSVTICEWTCKHHWAVTPGTH